MFVNPEKECTCCKMLTIERLCGVEKKTCDMSGYALVCQRKYDQE